MATGLLQTEPETHTGHVGGKRHGRELLQSSSVVSVVLHASCWGLARFVRYENPAQEQNPSIGMGKPRKYLQTASLPTPKCNPGWFMFDFLLVTMGVAEAFVGIASMACNMPDGSTGRLPDSITGF